MIDPTNPGMIAHAIAELSDRLEELTDTYREDIIQAAVSDGHFKKAWAEALLNLIATGEKMTVAEREARVELAVHDERVVAGVHEARAKATREALNSTRVRLDALRSLGANVRAQT